MKCISIKQPYAHLIATEKKRYEIRTWRTHYRGPLIVASSQNKLNDPKMPGGVLICLVNLIDVVPFTPRLESKACCKIDPDKIEWAWELEVITQLLPVKIKGKLGLYELPQLEHNYCNDYELTRLIKSAKGS